MNYKGKKYKKISMWWSNKPVKKGDLIVLHCRPGSDYLKYNGIYEVISDRKEIHIMNYNGEGATLCLKLDYNVGGRDYSKLVEINNKKKIFRCQQKKKNYINVVIHGKTYPTTKKINNTEDSSLVQ